VMDRFTQDVTSPGPGQPKRARIYLACFDVESVRRGGDAINTRAAVRRSNNEQSS
jgi:hypothetical protein